MPRDSLGAALGHRRPTRPGASHPAPRLAAGTGAARPEGACVARRVARTMRATHRVGFQCLPGQRVRRFSRERGRTVARCFAGRLRGAPVGAVPTPPTVAQPAPTVKHVVEFVGNALETSGLVKVNSASMRRGTSRKPPETSGFEKSKATTTEFVEPCFRAVSRIRLAACRNSSNLPKPLVSKAFERARIRESLGNKGFARIRPLPSRIPTYGNIVHVARSHPTGHTPDREGR